MEEVKEPSVRQGCLKSPCFPQITLHPCFHFSPSCSKTSQMFVVFFGCSLSHSSPNTAIPQALLGLLSPLRLPSARPFLLLPVGASQEVPLRGHLLPHHPLCYPAVGASWPVLLFGGFPSPSHLVRRFLGLRTPCLPPCPDHGNACNFSLPCKWVTPKKCFGRAQTLEGH